MPVPMNGWTLAATRNHSFGEIWFNPSQSHRASGKCIDHNKRTLFLYETTDDTNQRWEYKGSLWCLECVHQRSMDGYEGFEWLPEFIQYLKANHADLVLEEF